MGLRSALVSAGLAGKLAVGAPAWGAMPQQPRLAPPPMTGHLAEKSRSLELSSSKSISILASYTLVSVK